MLCPYVMLCVQIIENPDRLSTVKFWFMCRKIKIRPDGYFYFNHLKFLEFLPCNPPDFVVPKLHTLFSLYHTI